MTVDCVIENAALVGRSGLWAIAIQDGTIATVTPTTAIPADIIIDAQGQLLVPGFVDAHIHLDKAFLLNQAPAQVGDFAEALSTTFRLKEQYTVEDIQQRARIVLEKAIAFGITAMRSHVEVDPVLGLTSMQALLPLKQAYQPGITLQLAVFAQEGITQQPGTEALLRQAMAMGGDVIGSAPYVDPDPQRNIEIIFDIAQEFDCDVDFHLDFLDDDKPLQLPLVIAETRKRHWQGRVCLGHLTKLAALRPEQLAVIAAELQEAGISVLALPASDLYMMSRQDSHNVRRGVAPLHQLSDWGVTVGTATNNIQNLFTPFGDGDVLKIATLLAQVLQLGTTARQEFCLDLVTRQGARAIGITNYGVAPGCAADLVLLGAQSASEAIATATPNRTVFKAGKIVAKTQLQSQALWQLASVS
ncbi:MAG: amidohydrolase family protein [Leptolyngbya sp. SIOISBB]|nr:amidohydrolase family protein [Leptolyngbya sp. SIOISBB]